MKKILSILLAAVMLLSSAVLTVGADDETIGFGESVFNAPSDAESREQVLNADGVDAQGVYYTLNDEDLTAVVGKNTYADSASAVTEGMIDSVIIPTNVISNGVTYAVTAIGRNAFDGSDVKEVYIPYSCISIGEFAFAGCTELEYVAFGGSEIKGFAFWGCTSLTEVYIFKASSVGGGAFWNCSNIRSVSLSANTIMEKAFEGCDNIEYFVFDGTAPAVAAGALGTTAKAYIFNGASGYEDFPLETVVLDKPILDVEDVYAKGGDTVQVAVVANAAIWTSDTTAFSFDVALGEGLTLEGVSGESGIMEDAVLEGNTVSGNVLFGLPLPVVNLIVKVADTASGKMDITVSTDSANCIAGSVTVCDHANTKTVVIKSASCDEAGIENTVCVACGDIISTADVEAKGHTYKDFVIAPTCTEDGYTRHICECCSDAFTDSEVAATGHSWNEGEVIVQATPSKKGLIKYTCLTCGTVNEVEIPKIVYGDADNSGKVDLNDVTAVLKHIAKWDLTNFNVNNADADANAKINISDVTLLLKHIAKWDVELGPQK